MANQPSGIALYAALSEHIYRRNEASDQTLKLSDIRNGLALQQNIPVDTFGLSLQQDASGYIYSTGGGTSGFVAMVTLVDGKYVVTIRGTDSTLSAWSSVYQNYVATTPPPPDNPANLIGSAIDTGDGYTNYKLGFGTTAVTQWDAVKALVDWVINNKAGGDKSQVVVTGQSLGGGLAELASVYFGVEGDVFAPSPVRSQTLTDDFTLRTRTFAVAQTVVAHGPKFNATFIGLSDADKVAALALPQFQFMANYLKPEFQDGDSYAAIRATYQQQIQLALSPANLAVHTISGEALTAGTLLGVFINIGAQQIKGPTKSYDIGEASAEGKHSPALHALVVLTDENGSGSQKFADLLRGDQTLRYSIVGEPSFVSADPKMTVISGPVDHGRVGPAFDASKMLSVGANPYLLEDLLWKAYGTGSGNLYDYFYKFFKNVASTGAAGKGLNENSPTSIHDGVVKLALQVLRDAAQDTNALADVRSNLGGTWNFAGGSADGVPFSDKIIIRLDQIRALLAGQLEQLNGGPAQKFGVRDINAAVADAVFDDLTHSRGGVSAGVINLILGSSAVDIRSGVNTLAPWKVLVVQAGGDGALTYDAKQTDVSSDAANSHVIIGGKGGDNLKGSSAKDFIVGGEGNDTIEGGGGNDVIAGGKGDDRYIARPGPNATDSVYFLGGEGKDTAVYGSDFNNTSLKLSAAVLLASNPATGALVTVGSGGRADTLIGIERIEFGKADDVAKFSDIGQKLGITLSVSLGDNQIDRVKETEVIPSGATFAKGAFTTLEFSTIGATGPQRQTLDTNSQFEAKERANAIIMVNGHQLVGGATFDFDKFDMLSNGNVKPIWLSPPRTYPAVATDEQVQRWVDEQVEIAVKFFAGISGNIPGVGTVPMGPLLGLTFAPILYGQLARFKESWISAYSQVIIGVDGERYDLGTLNADGSRTLTITLNPTLDGAGETIVINHWMPGDYGIQIKQLGFGNGLDSGTNKNGIFESWQNVSLSTIRARLAEVGFTPNDVATPGTGGSGGSGGSSSASAFSDGPTAFALASPGAFLLDAQAASEDTPAPLARVGNDSDNDIAGGLGDDLLRGYHGNDDLLGDEGRDVYVFAAGDGHDVIEDLSPGGNIIRFLDGLDVASITKQLVADDDGNQDLLITYGAGDTILIKDWSLLSTEEQNLWTFESVHGTFTPANSADEPDLSVEPDVVGGVVPTFVTGTSGDDVINAADVDEQIEALAGNDSINAGGGSDIVHAGDGNDTVDGGAGNDRIEGGEGANVLFGGDGNDTITAGSGTDEIHGGKGNDRLEGGTGNDLYVFVRGDGQDEIYDRNGGTLFFSPPDTNNTLRLAGINPGEITIERDPRDPMANTSDPDQSLDIVLHVAGTSDSIRLVNQYGASGFLAIAYDGIDFIIFDNGVQWTRADLEARYLQQATTSGDDHIFAFYGNDRFEGKAGNDILEGNYGSDSYIWNRGDGNDHIRETQFNAADDTDRLVLGAGVAASDVTFVRTVDQSGPSNDLLLTIGGANGGTLVIEGYFQNTYYGIEKIAFADGTVWNRADIDQHYVATYLTNGNDAVYGTASADSIDGGAGNDTLSGGSGADTLDGGAGNDRLIGSSGETNDFDVYRFDANFGQDAVFDNGSAAGDPAGAFPTGGTGQDWIEFTAYNFADFTFARGGVGNADLIIARIGSTDQVTIEHFVHYAGLIENFKFADGTVLSWTDIGQLADRAAAATNAIDGTAAAETLTGTAAADRIAAGAGADTINAGDGNDVVNGSDGDDVINGENGSDMLLGGTGIDVIDGGDGDDIVYAGSGNDSVAGGTGADRLTGESGDDRLDGGAGDDSIYGGVGNDTLIGGSGNDLQVGGAGDDTYQFNQGDGQDIIQAGIDRAAGATRTLILGGGITAAELQYAFNGRDLILTFGATPTDKITLADFLGAGSVTSIVIGATTLTTTQILDAATGATSGSDVPAPIAIGTGATLVYGGRGNDTLTGDGTDNTFVFVKGDGQDRLIDPSGIFDSSNDELVLKGYAASETLLGRSGTDGGDLAITFTSGTDRIDVTRQLSDPSFNGIETIRFEDGTVWDASAIKARVLALAATSGNDSIAGFDDPDHGDVIGGGAGNDTLAGGTGNDRYLFNTGDGQDVVIDTGGDQDTLVFGTGIRPVNVTVTRSTLDPNDAILTLSGSNSVTLKGVFADATSGVDQVLFADGTVWSKSDLASAFLAGKATAAADNITGTVAGETLLGGLGNDTLAGGAGDDAYLFNRGDGQDTIIEHAASGNDRLVLGGGITSAQVSVRKGSVDPTDVVLDAGAGDTITLKAELNGTNGVEQIIFADGTVWGRADIDKKVAAAAQTSGADSITGSAFGDTITGGTGNDSIDGRDGADVYVFGRGDGQDTIADSGNGIGQDRIEFGPNIGAADVDFAHGTNPNDLVISIRGTTDRITVRDHFAAGGPKIGEIILKDGTALFAADIAALADNHAPTVANAIATQAVAQNGAFSFTVPANTFADLDADDGITLTATRTDGTALPSWLHFDGTSFTGTPANGDVGTLAVRLTAKDDAGESITTDFTINVTNVNDAPVSTGLITNKQVNVGSAFSFQLAANQFVDPDNGLPGVPTQTLTLSASLGSGASLPSWLTFNASTRTFSGTPTSGDQGALDIVVTASDGTATATTRFGIFVGTSGNTSPTVGTAMGTQDATEDALFAFQIPQNAFSDTTPGDHLRYSATLSNGAALPSWLTFDPITGLFTGTPANGDVGQSTIRVTATDISGASVSTNFTLRVNNVNDAPVANGTLSSFVTSQNSAFNYTIPANFFTDPDSGDSLQLVATLADGSALPDWLIFNPATRTFSGTPHNGDVGMLDIIVTAADPSNAIASAEMFILVTGVNDAPVVAHPLQPVEVDRLDSFVFTVPAGTFSDDKGGVALTARMVDGSALPPWLSFNPLTRTFIGTPDFDSVGDNEGVHVYRVAVTATDGEGASTSTILNVAVRGPNPPTVMFGSVGNDSIAGTPGPDTIYGLEGNDSMQGHEGLDTYVFDRGFGHDTIVNRYINASGLEVSAADDIISFGAGIAPSDITVTFADSFGSPSIFFNTSDPTIIDSFFKDDIILTVAATGDSVRIERQLDADRFVNFHHPIEQVRFADGTVWSAADLTAKVATGGAGNDLLAGDMVANVLSGGAGNDRLVAQDGNDTLIGGTGNDDLYGGLGDDVYIFNLGDGQDRILDVSQFQYGFNSFDTLRFGVGIRPIDLQFVRDTRDPFNFSSPADAGSLLVTISGTSDSIRIYWQYAIVDNLSAGIDQFEFADGTVLNRAQIDELVNPGNQIVGTDAAETLTGTAANETIIGKKGADFLQGADGNDTYIWNIGDGNDTIQEFNINSFDVVSFGIGVRPQDFTFSHIGPFGDESAGYYLYLTYTPTGEKLTVAYEFYNNTSNQPRPAIEEFRFADGTVWTQDTFINYFLASTPGNDIIQGFPTRADIMDGGAGNDELRGGSGGDTYIFGRGYGNDTIFDGTDGFFGNVVDRITFNNTVASTDVTISRVSHMDASLGWVIDTVFSITGTTDTLTVAGSNAGFDGDTFTSIFFGADSGFWSGSGLGARYLAQNSTSGNDFVIGFAANELINTGLGDDTLNGGRGNDTLTGGAGNDTYVFYRLPDTKIIRDAGLASDIDTLRLMPDVFVPDVTITRANNENDLILTMSGGANGIIILENRLLGAEYSADRIVFSDGTVWDFATIMAHTQAAPADARPINGTAAAEALTGTDFAETFDSLAGADTITGGHGDDIYIYRTGYGNDTIVEDNNSGETDTLKLRDLTSLQVVLLQSGNDLIINIGPTGEHITVKDQFNTTGTSFGIEEIVFSDRVVLRRAQIVSAGTAGTDAADSYTGDFTGNSFAGLGGNDTIDGAGGTDTAIFGGNWRDYAISYNAGTATFTLSDRRAGAPDGVDQVVNVERFQFADRTITVATAADLLNDAPTDITVAGGAIEENSGAGTLVGTLTAVDPDAGDSATFVAVSGATDKFDIVGNQIVLKAGAVIDFETASSYQLGVRVTDASGATFTKTVTITVTDVDESGINGTTGPDTLTGTSGPDRISGFGGNDTMIGAAGADTLVGGGDFDVASYAGAAAGVTANLANAALNTGDAAGDVYNSIEGLIGSSFNDALTGDANANTLGGATGNDTLDGGAGADTMTGGTGDDVFFVDSAGDVVTENASEGIDEVRATLASYTAAANVEKVTFVGSGAFTGIGNALDNVITGGAGDDTLDGGSGSDTLTGGAGNDIYVVDATTDVVTEGAGAGIDEVRTTLTSYTLGANLEKVTYLGSAAFTGIGNALDDSITGGSGDDTLDGGAGNDTLNGGAGNDLYLIDAAGDVVFEFANAGTDEVRTALASYALGANVENLTYMGAGNFSGTGSAVNNLITSGAGNDTLDGGTGNDTLVGGGGNDLYFVDATGDVVTEAASAGTDEVRTTASTLTLAANVEILTYTGAGNFNGTGNALDNVITGGIGNDTLNGGAGNDTLTGGAGNDVYTIDSASDVVTEAVNGGTDEERTALSALTLAANVEKLTFTGGSAAFAGTGNALNNTITGGSGADTLDGGAGNDSMTGGNGNDVYIVDALGDVITETSSGGTDEIRTVLTSFTLGTNLERLTFIGSGNFIGTGNTAANLITGGAGDDTLDGGTGNDTLVGGAGNDLFLVDAAGDVVTEAASAGTDEVRTALSTLTLAANVEILTYTGAGNFSSTGNAVNNLITGGAGNDTLDGGAGSDTLVGGDGNDVYVIDSASDVVIEGTGTDEIRTTLTALTLIADVENLTYTGSGAFAGTGNAVNNVITSGAGSDTLDGGAGDDTMVGGAGNDVYIVDSLNDVVTEAASAGTDEIRTTFTSFGLGANLEKLTFTGTGNFSGTGNTLANTLTGGAGDDTLDGGAGNDTLDGGAGNDMLTGGDGNDVYIVDSASDVVTEAASAGTDEIRTALANFALGAEVENLTFTGTGNFSGTGNALANTLTGGAGNDTLDGGTGTDTLVGGAGNDVYIVDVAADAITEAASAGIDEVRTALASYTLGTNLENLTYTGTGAFTGTGNTADNVITGGSGADSLSGGNGNDTLIGGGGNDTLVGGAGNDAYFVDQSGDVVTEAASAGTDEVRTTLASFTLATNLENLTFVGSGNFSGVGNTVANVLTGGIGNDTLDGGSGSDTLVGGDGNDVYTVDVSTDVVTESATGGTDEIRTALTTFTLGTNVENLTFTGTAAFTGTGNTLNNLITGASGADTLTGGTGDDTLNGGSGNDRLIGGTGNDVYIVDSASDVIVENASEGTDEVRTALTSFTLGTNVENLTFTGSTASTGTGNTLDNFLTGGSGADTLNGGSGNDFLRGLAGNDSLTGGTGNDSFVFDANFGRDTITDFTAGTGVADVIEFHGLFANFAAVQAASTQVGADVQITIDASTSILLKSVTLANLVQDDFRFL